MLRQTYSILRAHGFNHYSSNENKFVYVANIRTRNTTTEPLGDANITVREQTEENNVSESEKNAIIRQTYFSCFP